MCLAIILFACCRLSYRGNQILCGKFKLKRYRTTITTWIVFDIGNNLFYTGIVGLLFPLWITRRMGGSDATLGNVIAIAMMVAFFASPILGAVSDRFNIKMPLLILFSLLATLGLFFLGFGGYYQALVLFVVSLSSVHIANIFYNGLLADISEEANVGRIGGIGIGIGYLGSIIAIALSLSLTTVLGYTTLFQLTAVIISILYFPLFIWGHGLSSALTNISVFGILTDVLKTMWASFFESIRVLNWRRFLFARFWYLWAINGASSFAVLYGVETIQLSDYQIHLILITGITFAIPSGIFWGWLVDRMDSLFVLKTSVFVFFCVLLIGALIPVFELPKVTWWLVGLTTGIAMAGIYVSERPLLLRLAPKEKVGEYFGVYNMAGRLAAILAPFGWGFISVTLSLGQVVAVSYLSACGLISFLMLLRVRITK